MAERDPYRGDLDAAAARAEALERELAAEKAKERELASALDQAERRADENERARRRAEKQVKKAKRPSPPPAIAVEVGPEPARAPARASRLWARLVSGNGILVLALVVLSIPLILYLWFSDQYERRHPSRIGLRSGATIVVSDLDRFPAGMSCAVRIDREKDSHDCRARVQCGDQGIVVYDGHGLCDGRLRTADYRDFASPEADRTPRARVLTPSQAAWVWDFPGAPTRDAGIKLHLH